MNTKSSRQDLSENYEAQNFSANFRPFSKRITELRKDKIYSKDQMSKKYKQNKQKLLGNNDKENSHKVICSICTPCSPMSPTFFKYASKTKLEPSFDLEAESSNQNDTSNITSSYITSNATSLNPSVAHQKYSFKKTKSHIKTPDRSKRSRASMKSTTVKSFIGNDFQKKEFFLSKLKDTFDLDDPNINNDEDPYKRCIFYIKENVNLTEIINIPLNLRKEMEKMCNKRIELKQNLMYFNEEKDEEEEEESKLNLTY